MSLLRRLLPFSLIGAALSAMPLRASVALFMEDPYGHLGSWSPTGHAAIYLDHVCADNPTHLRRCQPGETGVVISRYHKVHHDDWLAMPLIPYLYSVDDVKDAPVSLRNRDEEMAVREKYWRAHLTDLVPPDENGNAPKGNWTQLVGSLFDRTAHVFEIASTPEQDDHFIAEFNAGANKSHFNFFLHNCADFSRAVLNIYFPHAIHRNYVADFGLTTPKQVAKCLVKYGQKHPDTPVRQYILVQTGGGIARSHRIRGVSESLLKVKKWFIPLLIVEPEVIGVSAIAYVTTGRYKFDHDAPPYLPEQTSIPATASAP
ncbi:hypothetical protein [Terriglobus aquaticus]|uniref:DUF4105 domain-containing protein n=1 Tax=Terriglobus aquaticus TaxID=940139 RepID=A0ABW9KIC2_9BACT|nr:hypothetical protein [Terriglobus aquaticus]